MYQAIRWRNNFMLKMGSEIQGPCIYKDTIRSVHTCTFRNVRIIELRKHVQAGTFFAH
jgi:hypothetical protein